MSLTLDQLEPYLSLIARDFAYGGYTMTVEPCELGSEIDDWAFTVLVDLEPAGVCDRHAARGGSSARGE